MMSARVNPNRQMPRSPMSTEVAYFVFVLPSGSVKQRMAMQEHGRIAMILSQWDRPYSGAAHQIWYPVSEWLNGYSGPAIFWK